MMIENIVSCQYASHLQRLTLLDIFEYGDGDLGELYLCVHKFLMDRLTLQTCKTGAKYVFGCNNILVYDWIAQLVCFDKFTKVSYAGVSKHILNLSSK